MTSCRPRRSPVTSRRGTVLVLAIWVILILAAMALVFTRSMRVEFVAAGNRLSVIEAEAVERGAEQYVLARIDRAKGDAIDVTSAPAEAVAVGDGYFWIIRPVDDDPNAFEYGIADEAAKLNLNSAELDELKRLPGMKPEFAAALVDWRDNDAEETEGGGAESDYYEMLQPVPYKCKNDALESIEELMLIKGATDGMVYGTDRNQNGAVDDRQISTTGDRLVTTPTLSMDADGRGLAPFVTVFSVERNVDIDGKARVAISAANANNQNPQNPGGGGPNPAGGNNGGGGNDSGRPRSGRQEAAPTPGQPPQPGQPGQPQGGGDQQINQELQKALADKLPSERVNQILSQAGTQQPFTSVLDFAKKGGMKDDELKDVFDFISLDDAKAVVGRVNVNTASRDVLATLTGLEEDGADALIGARPAQKGDNVNWVLDALSQEQINKAGAKLTGQSFQYSADIISINSNARAFKRVRIVVDARQSPPVIVRRQDLTSLGWPLPEDIRTRLKSGERLNVEYRELPPQGSN